MTLILLLIVSVVAVVAVIENNSLSRENAALKEAVKRGNFSRRQVQGEWNGVER